jgi:hypothetical protein
MRQGTTNSGATEVRSPGATRWRRAEGDRGWRLLARSRAGHCFWPRLSLS